VSRHESPELGDAILRLLRALVTRASEGDTEAIEQLRRIELLAPAALVKAARHAHERAGYSYTELADVLGVSRQAAHQRVDRGAVLPAGLAYRDGHQLDPGHTRKGCRTCKASSK